MKVPNKFVASNLVLAQHVQLRLLNVCRVECQNFLPVSPPPAPACPWSVSSSAAADSTLVGKPSLSALREEGGRLVGRRWEEGGGRLTVDVVATAAVAL